MRGLIVNLLLFLIIVCDVTAQLPPGPTVKLSLEDALIRAQEYSKELKEHTLDANIGEESLLDAKQDWIPEVGVNGSYGKLSNIPVFEDGLFNTPEYIPIEDHTVYDAGIEVYFNLYNGGKTKIQVKKENSRWLLLKFIQKQSEQNIKYEVTQYYLDLQRSLAFKKLIEQNILQNEQQLDQITKLYENGVVLKSDWLRSQLQLSRQKINLIKMTHNVELSMQALNILIGFEDETVLQPSDDIANSVLANKDTYQLFLDSGMVYSPFVKMASERVNISKIELKRINSDKLPKVGLFGMYEYSYPQIKLYPYSTAPYALGEIGFKVSYNISALFSDRHKERAAELEVDKYNVAQSKVEDNLRKSILKAYKELSESLEELNLAKMSIEQAEENYRIVHETYFNQLALLTDLLAADTQLLQAKFDLVNSQISARLNYYQLQKLTGQL